MAAMTTEAMPAGIEHLIEREYLERDKDQVQQSLVSREPVVWIAVSGAMNVCTTIQITIYIYIIEYTYEGISMLYTCMYVYIYMFNYNNTHTHTCIYVYIYIQ